MSNVHHPGLPDTPDAMLELLEQRSVFTSPFTKFLGVKLLSAWNGSAECQFEPRPNVLQHRGTIHGGVISSLIDNIGGWTATTILGPLVTTSLTVHFHMPATTTLTVRGNVVHHTRRTALVSATVHDTHRTLVATGLVTAVAVDTPAKVATADES